MVLLTKLHPGFMSASVLCLHGGHQGLFQSKCRTMKLCGGIHLSHGSTKSFMLQEEVLNGCQCFQMISCTLYVVPKNRAPGLEQLWKKGEGSCNIFLSMYLPEQQRKSILITWVFYDVGRQEGDDPGLVESCQKDLGVASSQGWGKIRGS